MGQGDREVWRREGAYRGREQVGGVTRSREGRGVWRREGAYMGREQVGGGTQSREEGEQGSRKSKIGWELIKNGCHMRCPGL